MNNRLLSGLLAGTILGSAMGAAPAAWAQTAPDTQDAPDTQNPADTAGGTGTQPETTTPVEGQTVVPSTSATGEPVKSSQDIVITGSRIPQPNLTSASPVTVLSSQEIKLQGTSRTEDLINSLPQSFGAQGSSISNGATGTATVNLRNLGPNRTVVLINGRRLMPGDILSPFPDINFVPTQLIKRVDVLTGGASSVYGADAVGGVVNFIMDNTFTGVRLDAQVSGFMHDNRAQSDIIDANTARGFRPPHGQAVDGGAADLAGVIGAAFDDGRGHVQAYATYRRQRSVLESSRDYSFCQLAARTAAQIAAGPARRFACGGSGTAANGQFQVFDPNFNLLGIFQVQGNQFVPGFTPFNFAPYNYFQRPDERYNLGAFADYEISPGFKPYLEAMFMDDRSNAVIAPSGAFANTFTLNCDNPLFSAQQRGIICAPGQTFIDANGIEQAVVVTLRRNVEGGGRNNDIEHTDYRIVGGMRGDVFKGVSYDAYYQYGRVLRNSTQLNDFSITRLSRALDVVTDPATGQPACRSVLNGLDANCVPYNIFRAGGVTQASLDYLQTPALQRGINQQSIAHADVTFVGADYGLKTPWAESGVGFNIGAEYRKEQLDLQVDEANRTGDLAGAAGPTKPISGQLDVRELFAEVQIPIIEHNFIDLLQVSGGYRYSDYKTLGKDAFSDDLVPNKFSTKVFKLAAEFAPVRDVRFRVSYNRAVRAPNIVELFFPTTPALAGVNDPCAGPAVGGLVQGFTAAQCALAGVTAAQFGNIQLNPANQYNGLFGGNARLKPETANTLTAGVILQPSFIPGLALTADYFNIKVKNVIGVQAYGSVFSNCFAGQTDQCALINRDQFGTLFLSPNGFVRLPFQNFPGVGLFTKGWDFSGSYSRRLGNLGTLNANFIGTLQGKTATLGTAGTGEFNGDSQPVPKWRHKARLGFTLPVGIGLSGQWRHFSAVSCAIDAACARPGNQKINAQNYFDLTMNARITNKFNFRFGANNILDKSPPVIGNEVATPTLNNGNTYPQVYDALGRYLFAGVTVDF